ncbi:MAG: Arm DNA-binding domain-containing protein [Steroidobacteraceae bacterium]
MAQPQVPPPLMHQISKPSPPRVRGPAAKLGVVRYPRRVSFGHSLHLLITPKGGRLSQYRYRFQGREKLLSFGCYPDVPMENARARGHVARQLLDLGVDPAERRRELRQMSAERV